MKEYNRFNFEYKDSDDLTGGEIEQKYELCITMYPAFKKYYEKNRYYSTVKPQMVMNIRKGDKIIGSGKFQWVNVKVNKKIKLFSFGLLIYPEHHNKGIGTYAIKLNIQKAKKMGADILFGSSHNKTIEKICNNLGFQILKCKVSYTTPEGKKKFYTKDNCYVYEFKKGIIDKINFLEEFYIGTGPI